MKKHKGVFAKNRKWWCKVRVEGEWKNIPTPFPLTDDPQKAAGFRAKTQARLDGKIEAEPDDAPLTVERYAEEFLTARRELGVRSVADDASRLKTWIYPEIGSMPLADVRPRHIAGLIRKVRMAQRAPRTVRNVNSVLGALFREASIAGHIEQTPCVLGKFQLGTIHDAKPEWRATAIFSKGEAEALVSDSRVPPDRRLLYAILVLGGLRHGEAAALCWRHYTTGLEPLGRITVARSNEHAQTKTGTERWMPVHPVLAAALAEWRLSGWPREFGRTPGPDDLIVPHVQPTNCGPRVRAGGMRRPHDSLKRFHLDLDVLGFRRRRIHDLRRTAVTLYREAGADPDVLRLCTHGSSRDVIEMYTTFGWAKLCTQIAPLAFERRAHAEAV